VDSQAAQIAAGRVLQVSVSAGGVPKLPVERAWVGPLGLDGDKHSEPTVHGGPHRAVCLFGIEVIERLQSEGHPIEPGGAGENLTTSGIEWSLLPVGARVRVGDTLELEVSSSTTPCATQTRNFSDGNFNRILIDRHPSDSRMYARVLREGYVAPGDAIVVLGAAPDSRAEDELLLKRLDRVQGKSMLAAWNAAREAGYQIEVFEDGEISMASSRELPGPAFNSADGLARLPNMLKLATRFFDRHGTRAWITADEPPWPAAVDDFTLDVFAAAPDEVADFSLPAGAKARVLGSDEGALFSAVKSGEDGASGVDAGGPNPWPAIYTRLARTHSRKLFLVETDGQPVAHASLAISAKTGWLRSALVTPQARGRGLQRALIAERARAAAQAGCDLIGAAAEPGSISADNLQQAGLRRVGARGHYIYDPK